MHSRAIDDIVKLLSSASKRCKIFFEKDHSQLEINIGKKMSVAMRLIDSVTTGTLQED